MQHIVKLLFPILISIGTTVYSQGSIKDYYKSVEQYEPNGENRYGLRNPKAPEALTQFDFMIGECHCTDSIPNQDGSYRIYPSIWKAKYMLNGYAIQDNNFNPINPTTNLRMYDSKTATWKVTYLQSANGYFTGVWEGGLNENGDMVLMADQNGNTSKLVFYNISKGGYNWKSESIDPDGNVRVGWRKHCVKQN